jgi:hypothetical protein
MLNARACVRACAGHLPNTLTTPPTLVTGKVGKDLKVEEGAAAARLCAISILGTLKGTCALCPRLRLLCGPPSALTPAAPAELGDLDRVKRVVKVFGLVNCVDGFGQQPVVMNGVSDFLVQVGGWWCGAGLSVRLRRCSARRVATRARRSVSTRCRSTSLWRLSASSRWRTSDCENNNGKSCDAFVHTLAQSFIVTAAPTRPASCSERAGFVSGFGGNEASSVKGCWTLVKLRARVQMIRRTGAARPARPHTA